MRGEVHRLSVIAANRLMGVAHRDGQQLGFSYTEDWLGWEGAHHLSLSMPMKGEVHGGKALENFLWGLLPDNTRVLEDWGKRFQVTPNNPFRLIEHVGEDCAGAIQFVPEAETENFLAKTDRRQIQWLTKADLVGRIETLLGNHGLARMAKDSGQFSLSGAQPKTALHFDEVKGRWGVPRGKTPTTHILKPALKDFEGYAQNEHFCLRLAEALGLTCPGSEVLDVGGNPVIVVKRYDRRMVDGKLQRVHQEDFCQVFGVFPGRTYQKDGGPRPKEIADALWTYSSAAKHDVEQFAAALFFNWLIAGTDAHGKNYSLLLLLGGPILLAPLYDISSVLPYPKRVSMHKAKMAMKVGSEYKAMKVGRRHWEACAKDLGLKPKVLLEQLAGFGERMPAGIDETLKRMKKEKLKHPIIDQLQEAIRANTKACLDRLAT